MTALQALTKRVHFSSEPDGGAEEGFDAGRVNDDDGDELIGGFVSALNFPMHKQTFVNSLFLSCPSLTQSSDYPIQIE